MNEPELVSTLQASDLLGVTPWTVSKMARDGIITPQLQGEGQTSGRWFSRQEIMDLRSSREADRSKKNT